MLFCSGVLGDCQRREEKGGGGREEKRKGRIGRRWGGVDGRDNLEFLRTSSICIIRNTPPNSDCSPILITTPYGKNPSLSLCVSPHTVTHSHLPMATAHKGAHECNISQL